jgi:hypothetical protein
MNSRTAVGNWRCYVSWSHYLVASADLESFVVLFNIAFDDENIEDLALVILE